MECLSLSAQNIRGSDLGKPSGPDAEVESTRFVACWLEHVIFLRNATMPCRRGIARMTLKLSPATQYGDRTIKEDHGALNGERRKRPLRRACDVRARRKRRDCDGRERQQKTASR